MSVSKDCSAHTEHEDKYRPVTMLIANLAPALLPGYCLIVKRTWGSLYWIVSGQQVK